MDEISKWVSRKKTHIYSLFKNFSSWTSVEWAEWLCPSISFCALVMTLISAQNLTFFCYMYQTPPQENPNQPTNKEKQANKTKTNKQKTTKNQIKQTNPTHRPYFQEIQKSGSCLWINFGTSCPFHYLIMEDPASCTWKSQQNAFTLDGVDLCLHLSVVIMVWDHIKFVDKRMEIKNKACSVTFWI